MGITIHYSAVIKDPKKIDQNTKYWMKKVPEMKRKLPEQFFPDPYPVFNVKEKSTEGKETADMFNAIYARGIYYSDTGRHEKAEFSKTNRCRGVIINPYAGSESISFVPCKTDKGWVIKSFTKTQYCGIPAHLTVCGILETAKNKFFPNMEIHDEADYCGKKRKDVEKLKNEFEESAIMIDKLTGFLKKAFPEGQIMTGGEEAVKEAKKLEMVL